MKDLLVFDMDGVLVDVSASYRAAIQSTVLHFTGTRPTEDEIQDWKNRGGWNDDWKLSHRMIQEAGEEATYDDVVVQFQKVFLGDNNDGLILKEKWLAQHGLFDRLADKHTLAIFTGRLRDEAHLTLNRYARSIFDPVVGADDVQFGKPHPEGLEKIRKSVPHGKIWYVGDTVDDAGSARAAGVPFIGIASVHSPRRDELVKRLREEGAVAVIEDINSLEAVIAENQ